MAVVFSYLKSVLIDLSFKWGKPSGVQVVSSVSLQVVFHWRWDRFEPSERFHGTASGTPGPGARVLVQYEPRDVSSFSRVLSLCWPQPHPISLQRLALISGFQWQCQGSFSAVTKGGASGVSVLFRSRRQFPLAVAEEFESGFGAVFNFHWEVLGGRLRAWPTSSMTQWRTFVSDEWISRLITCYRWRRRCYLLDLIKVNCTCLLFFQLVWLVFFCNNYHFGFNGIRILSSGEVKE